MSIILCMSFCIVLFAYFFSMFITAILLSRSCPIMDLKNVLMRQRALKDLSAKHEVARYRYDLLRDFDKDILQSTRLHAHALENWHKSTWPPTHTQFQSQRGLDYHSQSLGRTQCSNSEFSDSRGCSSPPKPPRPVRWWSHLPIFIEPVLKPARPNLHNLL